MPPGVADGNELRQVDWGRADLGRVLSRWAGNRGHRSCAPPELALSEAVCPAVRRHARRGRREPRSRTSTPVRSTFAASARAAIRRVGAAPLEPIDGVSSGITNGRVGGGRPPRVLTRARPPPRTIRTAMWIRRRTDRVYLSWRFVERPNTGYVPHDSWAAADPRLRFLTACPQRAFAARRTQPRFRPGATMAESLLAEDSMKLRAWFDGRWRRRGARRGRPPGPRGACGGFFCSSVPVDQSGEQNHLLADAEPTSPRTSRFKLQRRREGLRVGSSPSTAKAGHHVWGRRPSSRRVAGQTTPQFPRRLGGRRLDSAARSAAPVFAPGAMTAGAVDEKGWSTSSTRARRRTVRDRDAAGPRQRRAVEVARRQRLPAARTARLPLIEPLRASEHVVRGACVLKQNATAGDIQTHRARTWPAPSRACRSS